MSSDDAFAALRKLRVGCVKYLNSRPLICDYDGPVVFEHPSALAADLVNGNLDVALVPLFHALTDPECSIVDGVAVACDGPVYSVVLSYEGELENIQTIELDPASLSSAHLLKVILAEFRGIEVGYGEKGNAQLVIGNQAIEARLSPANDSSRKFLDLGEEWKKQTGLPFVFAVWVIRAGVEDPKAVADALRALKDSGFAKIPAIIDESDLADADFRRRYLTEYIRFDLGPQEKEAIARYRELLVKYKFIARADFPLRMV